MRIINATTLAVTWLNIIIWLIAFVGVTYTWIDMYFFSNIPIEVVSPMILMGAGFLFALMISLACLNARPMVHGKAVHFKQQDEKSQYGPLSSTKEKEASLKDLHKTVDPTIS